MADKQKESNNQEMVQALLSKAKNGSENAFQELMTRFEPFVQGTAYSFCQDRELACDIAQEVFFKVWKLIATVKEELSFASWLVAITRSTSIDLLRKKREVLLPEAVELSSLETPELSLVKDEKKAKFYRALDKLSVSYREIILLKYYQELSYKGMAHILSVPISTVEIRIFRARKKLKEILQEMDD